MDADKKRMLLKHAKYLIDQILNSSPTAYAFRRNCIRQAIKDLDEVLQSGRL